MRALSILAIVLGAALLATAAMAHGPAWNGSWGGHMMAPGYHMNGNWGGHMMAPGYHMQGYYGPRAPETADRGNAYAWCPGAGYWGGQSVPSAPGAEPAPAPGE